MNRIALALTLGLLCTQSAHAQQNMQQLLNQVDSGFKPARKVTASQQSNGQNGSYNRNAPAQAPVPAPSGAQPSRAQAYPQQSPTFQFNPQQFQNPNGALLPRRQPAAQPAPSTNWLQMLMGGAAPKAQATPSAPSTPQGLFQSFFGSGGNTAGAGRHSFDSGSVSGDLQQALDQSARAQDACERASSGEKDTRTSAAEEAQNDANEARAAAERATSAAANGDQQAADLAAQARNAADQAQRAADRATYNASQAE